MLQKFDMPDLRRKCKKLVRKKHKKTIKLKDVDKIWKAYVEYGITKSLLKYGKVEIDKFTTVEIVGEKCEQRNLIKTDLHETRHREGILYSVVMNDKNYKGNLIFNIDKNIKKRVNEELKNTNTYYKIK